MGVCNSKIVDDSLHQPPPKITTQQPSPTRPTASTQTTDSNQLQQAQRNDLAPSPRAELAGGEPSPRHHITNNSSPPRLDGESTESGGGKVSNSASRQAPSHLHINLPPLHPQQQLRRDSDHSPYIGPVSTNTSMNRQPHSIASPTQNPSAGTSPMLNPSASPSMVAISSTSQMDQEFRDSPALGAFNLQRLVRMGAKPVVVNGGSSSRPNSFSVNRENNSNAIIELGHGLGQQMQPDFTKEFDTTNLNHPSKILSYTKEGQQFQQQQPQAPLFPPTTHHHQISLSQYQSSPSSSDEQMLNYPGRAIQPSPPNLDHSTLSNSCNPGGPGQNMQTSTSSSSLSGMSSGEQPPSPRRRSYRMFRRFFRASKSKSLGELPDTIMAQLKMPPSAASGDSLAQFILPKPEPFDWPVQYQQEQRRHHHAQLPQHPRSQPESPKHLTSALHSTASGHRRHHVLSAPNSVHFGPVNGPRHSAHFTPLGPPSPALRRLSVKIPSGHDVTVQSQSPHSQPTNSGGRGSGSSAGSAPHSASLSVPASRRSSQRNSLKVNKPPLPTSSSSSSLSSQAAPKLVPSSAQQQQQLNVHSTPPRRSLQAKRFAHKFAANTAESIRAQVGLRRESMKIQEESKEVLEELVASVVSEESLQQMLERHSQGAPSQGQVTNPVRFSFHQMPSPLLSPIPEPVSATAPQPDPTQQVTTARMSRPCSSSSLSTLKLSCQVEDDHVSDIEVEIEGEQRLVDPPEYASIDEDDDADPLDDDDDDNDQDQWHTDAPYHHSTRYRRNSSPPKPITPQPSPKVSCASPTPFGFRETELGPLDVSDIDSHSVFDTSDLDEEMKTELTRIIQTRRRAYSRGEIIKRPKTYTVPHQIKEVRRWIQDAGECPLLLFILSLSFFIFQFIPKDYHYVVDTPAEYIL